MAPPLVSCLGFHSLIHLFNSFQTHRLIDYYLPFTFPTATTHSQAEVSFFFFPLSTAALLWLDNSRTCSSMSPDCIAPSHRDKGVSVPPSKCVLFHPVEMNTLHLITLLKHSPLQNTSNHWVVHTGGSSDRCGTNIKNPSGSSQFSALRDESPPERRGSPTFWGLISDTGQSLSHFNSPWADTSADVGRDGNRIV